MFDMNRGHFDDYNSKAGSDESSVQNVEVYQMYEELMNLV